VPSSDCAIAVTGPAATRMIMATNCPSRNRAILPSDMPIQRPYFAASPLPFPTSGRRRRADRHRHLLQLAMRLRPKKTRRAPASIVSNVNEVKSLLPWIQLSAPPIEKVIKRVSVRVEANKTRNIRATFICSPRGGASPNWVMEELSIWRLASFVQCGNTFVTLAEPCGRIESEPACHEGFSQWALPLFVCWEF
jgi:hypothetical protein